MTQNFTPEANAIKILLIYQHFNSKIGDELRANNFIAVGRKNSWDMRDLQSGLDFAVENGWLKRTPSGWLGLTEAGFEKMPQ